MSDETRTLRQGKRGLLESLREQLDRIPIAGVPPLTLSLGQARELARPYARQVDVALAPYQAAKRQPEMGRPAGEWGWREWLELVGHSPVGQMAGVMPYSPQGMAERSLDLISDPVAAAIAVGLHKAAPRAGGRATRPALMAKAGSEETAASALARALRASPAEAGYHGTPANQVLRDAVSEATGMSARGVERTMPPPSTETTPKEFWDFWSRQTEPDPRTLEVLNANAVMAGGDLAPRLLLDEWLAPSRPYSEQLRAYRYNRSFEPGWLWSKSGTPETAAAALARIPREE